MFREKFRENNITLLLSKADFEDDDDKIEASDDESEAAEDKSDEDSFE